MTKAISMIGVTIPLSLCGMELSKNGRVHWSKRNRAFQEQKEWVWAVLWNEFG